MGAAVLMAVVLAAMVWSAVWLVRLSDARGQDQLVAHQTLEADLWARMLSARMDAHQRLLSAVAQGVHTSLLDKPEVLDALMQQEGSILRLFTSLHVALPSGSISHHGALGQTIEMDTQGLDALRRTIAEGKPMVVMVPAHEDGQHLQVLLTVPMRNTAGSVSGALAAMVKLPLAALLPELVVPQQGLQYMLLDNAGQVLVHSDITQRWKNVQDVVGGHWSAWQALSQPSTANADTQIWGQMLATRVGLPLPQWQAVVLRDISGEGLWQQGLSPQVWLALAGGAALLTLLAGGLLWGWLAPSLHKARAAVPATPDGPQDDAQTDPEAPAAEDRAAWPAQTVQAAQAATLALFEAMPAAMLLEVGGVVTLHTPQAEVMLGYFGPDADALRMQQLLGSPALFAEVRSTLVELGSYEGTLQMRKKDGDWVGVQVMAWTPSQWPAATVWRLRLPWRQRRSTPLPDGQHVWRDSLTGLPNREALMWELQAWMTDSVIAAKAPASDTAPRKPAQGCVLFVDVDHLGMMNETTSREMGNQVLCHVARLLSNYTQPLGSVARLGGDEFAVLLPGISLAHAQGIGQVLCDAVWRWQPSWGGERHWVTISIGIVAVDAQRHTPQQALHAADMACYEAKRRGRCQVAAGPISAPPPLKV